MDNIDEIRRIAEQLKWDVEEMKEDIAESRKLNFITADSAKGAEYTNAIIMWVLLIHSGIMVARHFGWID